MKVNRECKNDKHARRDNDFGVTWCVRCGRLYNKPVGRKLTDEDKVKFNTLGIEKARISIFAKNVATVFHEYFEELHINVFVYHLKSNYRSINYGTLQFDETEESLVKLLQDNDYFGIREFALMIKDYFEGNYEMQYKEYFIETIKNYKYE